MTTDSNNDRQDKSLTELIDEFSEQAHKFFIDWSSGIDTLRAKGATDKKIRDSLIATSKMSFRLIDALMLKDYELFCEVWMSESGFPK